VKFAIIPRADVIKRAGSWLHVHAQPGDRGPSEPSNIRRVGLDGWPEPLPVGKTSRIAFNVKMDANCIGPHAGDWLNFFELHAVPAKGEPHPPGPLTLTLETSAKDGNPYIRPRTRKWGDADSKLHTAQLFKPGHDYRIVVTHRIGLISWLFVSIDGVTVASSLLGFGYGNRPLYAQFRIYCNERPGAMDAWFRVEGYDLPS
tara:strand:+ start:2293 stop:2898 length:606 start_codon:yes stop_codon:yes gene_type:complete